MLDEEKELHQVNGFFPSGESRVWVGGGVRTFHIVARIPRWTNHLTITFSQPH